MLLLSKGVVANWSAESWKRNRKRFPDSVFYQVVILAGPTSEVKKSTSEGVVTAKNFGQDPYEYKILKPL